MLPAEPPEAIIFDWDGTLVDCWPSIHNAMNATLEAMGHDAWTYEETLARVRKSMRNAFPEMFGDRWEEAGRIFYEHVAAHHLEGTTVLGGAEDALAAANASAPYVGVVSNKQGPLLRAEIDHLDWRGYIARAVGAGDAEEDKPAPAAMDLVLEETGIKPGAEVWYIGDTGIDMRFAEACGCTGVLIGEKAFDANELGGITYTAHFADLAAFTSVIAAHQERASRKA